MCVAFEARLQRTGEAVQPVARNPLQDSGGIQAQVQTRTSNSAAEKRAKETEYDDSPRCSKRCNLDRVAQVVVSRTRGTVEKRWRVRR